MLWKHENFIELLKTKLETSLPGINAQLKMAPEYRKSIHQIPENARLGGVMIVLYKKENEWHIILMRRTEDGGTHSGQISFPGGKKDLADESIMHTAIRELHEEIGIPNNEINILGQLTNLYIPPSNFLITPILGYWNGDSNFTPSKNEVQEIIEQPLHQLFSIETKGISTVARSDNSTILMQVPIYKINDRTKIWGATAMVLRELEELCFVSSTISK